MFHQIEFKKKDGYTNYAYAISPSWLEYAQNVLRISGYEIAQVDYQTNPWEYHSPAGSLWAQRDKHGSVVFLLDDEDSCDLLYWAADFAGNSKLGERVSVERPVEYHEEH